MTASKVRTTTTSTATAEPTPEPTAQQTTTASDQKEATTVEADSSYELHLKFVDITGDSRIRVETPSYTVTDSLKRSVRAM